MIPLITVDYLRGANLLYFPYANQQPQSVYYLKVIYL